MTTVGITTELLVAGLKSRPDRVEPCVAAFAEACALYGINETPQRLAYFLAHVGHESGGLRWLREIWGPTAAQRRYERNFDAPWPATPGQAKLSRFATNRLAYRLGNTERGDGKLFMGRGGIQTTGRGNYVRLRDRLRERGVDCPDFEAEPHRLQEPHWAIWSAADYWGMKNLNDAADAGDFHLSTKLVNGGYNGLEDREQRLAGVLGIVGFA
jgi:putative chitinase